MLVGDHTFKLIDMLAYVFHERLQLIKIERGAFFVVLLLRVIEKLGHLFDIAAHVIDLRHYLGQMLF